MIHVKSIILSGICLDSFNTAPSWRHEDLCIVCSLSLVSPDTGMCAVKPASSACDSGTIYLFCRWYSWYMLVLIRSKQSAMMSHNRCMFLRHQRFATHHFAVVLHTFKRCKNSRTPKKRTGKSWKLGCCITRVWSDFLIESTHRLCEP